MNVERILAKAAAECESGRTWRAREILSSAIPQSGFEPRLFLALGELLLRLGDQLEAGKYLMLSGSRRPEFIEAIELFVKRYGGSQPQRLYAALPRAGRLPHLSDYPPPLSDELRSLGLPEKLRPERPEIAAGAAAAAAVSPLVGCALAIVLGVCCAAIFILGLQRAGEIIFHGMR